MVKLIAVKVREDGLTVCGHAGYAPPGQDIVCAGVSALVYTLIQSMDALVSGEKIEYSLSPGRVDIDYKDLSEQGRLLVDSFFIGICQIADAYKDYVQIV